MAVQLGSKARFISEEPTAGHIGKAAASCGIETISSVEVTEHLSLQDEMARSVSPDDILVVVSARPGSISYDPALGRIPQLLLRNSSINNFIILYPEQIDLEDMVSFSDPMGNS